MAGHATVGGTSPPPRHRSRKAPRWATTMPVPAVLGKNNPVAVDPHAHMSVIPDQGSPVASGVPAGEPRASLLTIHRITGTVHPSCALGHDVLLDIRVLKHGLVNKSQTLELLQLVRLVSGREGVA